MVQYLSKYWTFGMLMTIVFFFITVHFTFNTVFVEHHLEPLFSINSTYDAIHVKINPNFTTYWTFTKTRDSSNFSDPVIKSYYSKLNVSHYCSEIPPGLHGKVRLTREAAPSFTALLNEFENSSLQVDGRYLPPDCIPRHQVAIIVPYRNRFEHLNIFLRNIHPFLQKQQLDYTIFVVEQAGDSPFNRGMLMNVGFVEALKLRPFTCFIFHDVDLLPEDDRNIYSCPEQPRHMSVAVNVFRYKLPYPDIFGGVSAMSAEHFQLVNGFSNTFWGWGGEDDDMSMRIKMKGLHLARYPFNIARYTMLTHEKQKANPYRFEKLYHGRKRFKTEGLNSLEYRRIEMEGGEVNDSLIDFPDVARRASNTSNVSGTSNASTVYESSLEYNSDDDKPL